MNEMRTHQTRLAVSSEQAALLDAYAALYGKAERTLFARLSAGESLSVLKRSSSADWASRRGSSTRSRPECAGRSRRSKQSATA